MSVCSVTHSVLFLLWRALTLLHIQSPKLFILQSWSLSVHIKQIPTHCRSLRHHSTFCIYESSASFQSLLSGIAQYLSSCARLMSLSVMSSRSCCAGTCVRVSFLLRLSPLPYVYISCHLVICWWTLGLPPWRGCESCCYEHRCTNTSLKPCFQFFWVYTQKQNCWIVW